MSKLTLLDEARQMAAALPGPLCDVVKALHDHPALADEMSEAIRDHEVSANVLEDVLASRDIKVSSFTIRRHRQNRCINCRKAGVVW